MKRTFSLFLALVMLLGSLAGLSAVAEGEIPAPVVCQPEIAYTNVAYADGIVLMFAVDAPAELPEGAKVELLLWKDALAIGTFSADDKLAKTILAEAEKSTIGGAEYLVFKYDGLSAEMMTDVIYARPVYTDADGKRTYGDVIDYSVVEYVKVANGEFDGFAGLAEDKKNVLNSLLGFGGAAQKYLSGDETAHAPNGYLANDTLNKIWVTPVINGVEKAKVFGGFFKYAADGVASVYTPFYDMYELVCIKGADGTVLSDSDEESDGIQVALTAEGDLNLTAEYKSLALFDADVEASIGNMSLNTNAAVAAEGAYGYYDNKTGGLSFNTSQGYKKSAYCYNSLDVIDDPYNPGQKTYRWVSTKTSAIQLGDAKDEFNNQLRFSKSIVFDDTVAPVITVELVLGGTADNADVNLGKFRIRGTGTNDLLVPFAVTGGQVIIYTSTDGKEYTPLSVKIPKDGYAKYAIVIDFENELVSAYVEGEDGNMVKEVETNTPNCAGTNVNDMGWLNWAKANHQKWEWHGGTNNLTAEEKALVGDSATPDLEKLAEIASAKYSVLIKDINVVFGNSAEQ